MVVDVYIFFQFQIILNIFFSAAQRASSRLSLNIFIRSRFPELVSPLYVITRRKK